MQEETGDIRRDKTKQKSINIARHDKAFDVQKMTWKKEIDKKRRGDWYHHCDKRPFQVKNSFKTNKQTNKSKNKLSSWSIWIFIWLNHLIFWFSFYWNYSFSDFSLDRNRFLIYSFYNLSTYEMFCDVLFLTAYIES